VNLADTRLYYYPKKTGPRVVETFAISAGRDEWQTPEARLTHIARRLENPSWYPPRSIREEHQADGRPLPPVVPPGPDNPLGPLAMKLAIPGGYFIHGTSKPFGIGMRVTHGCLRLYPEDMAQLFAMVPVGTKVRVVNQPHKVAWIGDVLHVEVHPRVEDGVPRPVDITRLREDLTAAAATRRGYEIDWAWMDGIALQPRGVPIVVRRQPP
jgi:L,D-transpeptidase ErfK/SrfK